MTIQELEKYVKDTVKYSGRLGKERVQAAFEKAFLLLMLTYGYSSDKAEDAIKGWVLMELKNEQG